MVAFEPRLVFLRLFRHGKKPWPIGRVGVVGVEHGQNSLFFTGMQTNLAVQAGFDGSKLRTSAAVGTLKGFGPMASYPAALSQNVDSWCVFAIQHGIDDGTTQKSRQSL